MLEKEYRLIKISCQYVTTGLWRFFASARFRMSIQGLAIDQEIIVADPSHHKDLWHGFFGI